MWDAGGIEETDGDEGDLGDAPGADVSGLQENAEEESPLEGDDEEW